MSDSRLSFYPEEEDGGRQYSLVARQPSQLEEIFRSCRLVSSELLSEAQQAATTVTDQAQGGYEELQAPENLAARLGVMGGLAGLALVASRGRLVWSAAGAGTGAAICYPQSFQAIGQSAYNGELPDLPSLDTAKLSDFVLKSGEYFHSAITSIKQITKQELAEDQPKITKESTLLFVKPSELQPPPSGFKGDRGMSREEDKDLYATRE